MESSIPPIPVELLEYILKEVNGDDRQSLKNCSLASRAFLHVARRFLFQSVTISLGPDDTNGEAEDDTPHSSFPLLSFLLKDAHTSSSIRELCILKDASTKFNPPDSKWSTTTKHLTELLPKLKRLRYLSIHSSFFSDWTVIDEDLRRLLIGFCHIPTLERLSLSFMGLRKEELLHFVCIPRLTLCGIYIIQPTTPTSTSTQSGLSLTRQSDCESKLQDLHLITRHPDAHPEVWSIVEAAGQSLTSLMCFSSPYHSNVPNSPLLDMVDLSALQSLLFLTICVSLEHSSIAKFAHLLKGINRQSKLESIQICCDLDSIDEPGDLSSWDWGSLDAILTSPIYEALECVKISMKGVILPKHTPPRDNAALKMKALDIFQTHLPAAHARGLIVEGPDVVGVPI